MIKTIKYLIIVLLGITVCCTSQKTKNPLVRPDATSDIHSAQNSLDWSGTYSGIVPCASCDGIETELHLGKDLTYTLTTKYLDKQAELYSVNGTFEWIGNNIKLAGITEKDRPNMYKVEENRLRQLDMAGNVITGELEHNYILTKNGNPNGGKQEMDTY